MSAFRETAVVVRVDGQPIAWHAPAGRSAVAIPDTRDLWEILMTHRDVILGVAHTHPGCGQPSASEEDRSTFQAVEDGLGRPLHWWIASEDDLVLYGRMPNRIFRGQEARVLWPWVSPWLSELRRRSYLLDAPAPTCALDLDTSFYDPAHDCRDFGGVNNTPVGCRMCDDFAARRAAAGSAP